MERPGKPAKIIWVVMDTLRADHLGLYGYPRPTSPFLDKLGDESIVFDWAFSACPYSIPSQTSMLSGRYCSNHYLGFSKGAPIKHPFKGAMLSEALLSAGYATASFVTTDLPVHPAESSAAIGFRNRFNPDRETGANGTNKMLAAFISALGENDLFAFLNYLDIHGPYLHQEPHRSLFTSDQWSIPPLHLRRISPDSDPLGGLPEFQILEGKEQNGLLREYRTDLRYYLAQYDAGIRKADQALEKLVELLQERGVYDDTLLIVTSDHGEAFGENNLYCTHGFTLTPDQIHVPLLLKPHRGWRVEAGRIETQVSLVDLMPTILELAGLHPLGPPLDGRSLVGLVQQGDQELEKRTILAETCFQTCRVDGKNLSISPRAEEDISALRPPRTAFPGQGPVPETGILFKESLNLEYRQSRPSPLAHPPDRVFFQPLPWMDKDQQDLALKELRQEAVAELLWTGGSLVSKLDYLDCELNRLRGELASIPAPIRRLVRLLRSRSWLRKAVGRLRKIYRGPARPRP